MDINMAYDGLDDLGFTYSGVSGDAFSDDHHYSTADSFTGNTTKDNAQQSLPHVSSGSVSSYQSLSPTEKVPSFAFLLRKFSVTIFDDYVTMETGNGTVS
ncbi:unnamed protein product [Trichobilharzia regenti]|nr:unnamed protein product [Trichobilharzia regenti]